MLCWLNSCFPWRGETLPHLCVVLSQILTTNCLTLRKKNAYCVPACLKCLFLMSFCILQLCSLLLKILAWVGLFLLVEVNVGSHRSDRGFFQKSKVGTKDQGRLLRGIPHSLLSSLCLNRVWYSCLKWLSPPKMYPILVLVASCCFSRGLKKWLLVHAVSACVQTQRLRSSFVPSLRWCSALRRDSCLCVFVLLVQAEILPSWGLRVTAVPDFTHLLPPF